MNKRLKIASLALAALVLMGAAADKLEISRTSGGLWTAIANVAGTFRTILVSNSSGGVSIGMSVAGTPTNNFLNGGLGITGTSTTNFAIAANNTVTADTTFFPFIYNQGYPQGGGAPTPRAQYAGNGTSQVWGLGADNANNVVFGSANASTGLMTNIWLSTSTAGTGGVTLGATTSGNITHTFQAGGNTTLQLLPVQSGNKEARINLQAFGTGSPAIYFYNLTGSEKGVLYTDTTGDMHLAATFGNTGTLFLEGGGAVALKVRNDSKVEVKVREDGSCGIGTVCAGTFTTTVTCVTANCPQGNVTNRQAFWSRTGNVVTVSGQFDARCATSTGDWAVTITPPVASNFTSVDDAAGTFAHRGDTSAAFRGGGQVLADVAGDKLQADSHCLQINDTEQFSFTAQYLVK